MEQENFIEFIKELMSVDKYHQEYQDNDVHYVIDAIKDESGELTIKVNQVKDNKDRKEFEKWLELVDDGLFTEILESLQEDGYDIDNLDQVFNTKDYKKVIDIVKGKAKELAENKIKAYQKLF